MVHPNSKANLAPPWPKGTSGNPGGRAKGIQLQTLLIQALTADDNNLAKKVVMAGIEQALDGNAPIWKEIWDRVDGKVKDRLISEVRQIIQVEIPGEIKDDETKGDDDG